MDQASAKTAACDGPVRLMTWVGGGVVQSSQARVAS